MKKLNILIYIFTFIAYEEIIFSILTIHNIENILLKTIFLILVTLIIDTFIKIFKEKHRKTILTVFILSISVVYIIYYIYYQIFENVLSVYSIINGTQAIQFTNVIINNIILNWYGIILLIIPFIAHLVFFKNKLKFNKSNIDIIINIIVIIVIYLLSLLMIEVTSNPNEIYSNKNLYYNINNTNYNLNRFGLITTIRLDIQRTIINFKEKSLYTYENEEGEKKLINKEKYNVLDIDFQKLIENETNKEIIEIHEYLSKQEPTSKNEYTGIFKDKNLIVIVAESFSELAIREDLTPTLYKMNNQGFNFKNFYTPLFPVSTADGEYLTDTSLIPAEGTWSIEKVAGNYIPYSYPNALKSQGYKTYAYHNYDYNYYNRQEYFKTMGYDNYLAKGNGLEERMSFKEFPASDYEMIKSTVSDYINEDKFIAYYMTISGHIEYDTSNAIVRKNWDKVKDLPYSDKAKAYLATQIELDLAMEELISQLEQNNKIDDTVIIITGDHYPYGLTLDEMNELSTYERDRTFDKFRMPFILYNSQLKENIEIQKYAWSLDVLPTMLNLFGVEYDSRLLMGKDILSNAKPLIIFSDRSFIEENGRYDSNIEKYSATNEKNVDEEYIKKIEKSIYYKYRYSRLILENDYYASLKKAGAIN